MAFQPELVSTYKLVYDLYRLELADRHLEASEIPDASSVEAVLNTLEQTPAWRYRGQPRARQRHKVRSYLLHPQKFDPDLDPVAMARAVNFDWLVIARLTDYEKWALPRLLAKREDPFGWLSLGALIGGHGVPAGLLVTGRAGRFMAGPPSEQERLRNIVLRLRDRPGPLLAAIEPVELGLAA